MRRYKAHLDERDKPKPSEPDYCSFCLQPASDERALVGNYRYNLICETCANEAIVVFAERRKRR